MGNLAFERAIQLVEGLCDTAARSHTLISRIRHRSLSLSWSLFWSLLGSRRAVFGPQNRMVQFLKLVQQVIRFRHAFGEVFD